MLGAEGLVLPALTGILPCLSMLAAPGFGLLMVGAIITHLRREEFPNAITNLLLFVLTGFVGYGLYQAMLL
jgi:hypothetical protein